MCFPTGTLYAFIMSHRCCMSYPVHQPSIYAQLRMATTKSAKLFHYAVPSIFLLPHTFLLTALFSGTLVCFSPNIRDPYWHYINKVVFYSPESYIYIYLFIYITTYAILLC
jgi:hypothetical protein